MLRPLFATDLLLSLMTDSIQVVKIFLADKLLSWIFAIGIVDISETDERNLTATFGCNLPVSDAELAVASIVFYYAGFMAPLDASSKRRYLGKKSRSFHVLGYQSPFLEKYRDIIGCCLRAKLGRPNVIIKCLHLILDLPMSSITENDCQSMERSVVAVQFSLLA